MPTPIGPASAFNQGDLLRLMQNDLHAANAAQLARDLPELQKPGAMATPNLDRLARAGQASGPSFTDLVGRLVNDVDAKGKEAASQVQSLVAGESDNLHQTMIAMQESGLAFTLLVEVRNKLVESYQELMRMPV
ncbi:MAG: flagellar hook-basal body complex protein FliE [Puniceicoccaceae bacterium]|nr:MAG: flagellar hook-basal body complex protein FliE [Puniceicoccaceae bacterium]